MSKQSFKKVGINITDSPLMVGSASLFAKIECQFYVVNLPFENLTPMSPMGRLLPMAALEIYKPE